MLCMDREANSNEGEMMHEVCMKRRKLVFTKFLARIVMVSTWVLHGFYMDGSNTTLKIWCV